MNTRGFLTKTLHDFAEALDSALPDTARRAGLFQSLDPRAKLLDSYLSRVWIPTPLFTSVIALLSSLCSVRQTQTCMI